MRVWDVPCEMLENQNLLGEHRELHAIWNILTQDKRGYRDHPETKRWEGKLKALYKRHEEQVTEMKSRDMNHDSPLDEEEATGEDEQDEVVDTLERQYELLKEKDALKTRNS